tara:strand:- start:25738 stop:25977 length:240 start_codon:yes stop_codon:yes gene_type:complete
MLGSKDYFLYLCNVEQLKQYIMSVQDLIDALQKIEDKSVNVRVPIGDDEVNLWVNNIEVSSKGQSGYELDGEVRLIVSE